ncbi:MAG: hypothetical protein ACXADY_21420 [Candidatus Hodarchaeales archaeon]|jgi:hypothetical protein
MNGLKELQQKLEISEQNLKEINNFLLQGDNPLIIGLLELIDKYGGVDEINRKAKEAKDLDNILSQLEKIKPKYVEDLEWLYSQRDQRAFISINDYRRKILGEDVNKFKFDESFTVTLELSACQYFPFLIEGAQRAIDNQDLMPGRIIRVRRMKEQELDGDLLAMTAAMQIIGSTYVETLDTKGTAPGPDGNPVNIHLGGPATITGYFGGVGQPNDFALKWIDEYLYYYTKYGVNEVLNLNLGTILLGYFLHKLGVNNEFKISVFVGNDNPYSCFWTLLAAKLFARDDGSSPLIGFNLANSVNNQTIELSAYIRNEFGFEDVVRLEHHIIETQKSIVRQPYDRRQELIELASKVKNISAKHEGGDVEVDSKRDHPTDILDYFRAKEEIINANHWDALRINYLDRQDAINTTARILTEKGISFFAARNLHHRE